MKSLFHLPNKALQTDVPKSHAFCMRKIPAFPERR